MKGRAAESWKGHEMTIDQDNNKADIRDDPGKWIINLFEGLWSLAGNLIGKLLGLALFLIIGYGVVIWLFGLGTKYHVIAFGEVRAKPAAVAEGDNWVAVAYLGQDDKPLTQAKFTVKIFLQNGERLTSEHYVDEWEIEEPIVIDVDSSSPVERVELRGTGYHDGNRVRLCYYLDAEGKRVAL